MTRAQHVQTDIDIFNNVLTYQILTKVWHIFVESFRLSNKIKRDKVNVTRVTFYYFVLIKSVFVFNVEYQGLLVVTKATLYPLR